MGRGVIRIKCHRDTKPGDRFVYASLLEQYIAMRALSWPDAFPHTDLGIRKALGKKNPREILKTAEKWRPWRAYAVLHLWNSLTNEL